MSAPEAGRPGAPGPDPSDGRGDPRRVAWWTVGVLVVVSVWLAAMLTPWGTIASGDPALLSEVFDRTQIDRANRFHAEMRWASYLSLACGLLVALWLGLTRSGLALVRRVAGRLRWWWIQVVVAVAAVTLVGWLVTLPFRVWQESVLREWGVSTQTWGAWLVDQAKAFGVGVGLSGVALVLLVGVARLLPRWWFLPAGAGVAALVFGMSFAYPLLIEPVFNSFEPMPDNRLRGDLLEMAARDDVPVDEVLVADASRRTTNLNAYVSGLGSTQRIVVYDTLLEDTPPAQIESIVAHELGHAKNDDVQTGSIVGSVTAATLVVALWFVMSSRWVRRLGVSGMADPVAVAVVLALANLMVLVGSPFESMISREIEARADRHALELTGDPESMMGVQKTMSRANLSDVEPPWLVYVMFASHPTPLERVTMAGQWAEDHDAGEP
ncbi:MAG: M48 family metalloprotease [Propionibacteriales bacterium]|nr:M48 family metalloprotease [Propionibacteriales bacterium]